MDFTFAVALNLAIRFALTVVAVLASVVLQLRARRRKMDVDERLAQITNLITLPFAAWFVVFLIGASEFGMFGHTHWLLVASGITGSLLNIVSALHMPFYGPSRKKSAQIKPA